MASAARRAGGQAWLATVLGIVVLVAGGFVLGLVVGVVSEEPELVVGHVAGRSTEIAWSANVAPGLPAVSAPRPAAGREPQTAPVAAPSTRDATVLGEAVAQAPGRRAAPHAPAPRPVVPAPAVQAAARPQKAEGAARYAIQVGAFATDRAARQVADGLRGRGYTVYIVESESDGRWRVRVGPVAQRATADEMARVLKADEKLPTWVLEERGS